VLKARVPQPYQRCAKTEGLGGSGVAFSLVSFFWLSKRKKLAVGQHPTIWYNRYSLNLNLVSVIALNIPTKAAAKNAKDTNTLKIKPTKNSIGEPNFLTGVRPVLKK
jgi:hypothetical protein